MTDVAVSLRRGARLGSTSQEQPDITAGTATPAESSWLAWGRSLGALAIVATLLALGIANIAIRAEWRPVEDGALWSTRAEGVTVVEVAPGSPADQSGLARGDVLIAIDGSPVKGRDDVVRRHSAASSGALLTYTLSRGGQPLTVQVPLEGAPAPGTLYFLLATVGFFTLLVGASVRLRRPRDQATLHFFWLCVAFFGQFTFSFNGPFDRLDWIFYWGDAIATVMLPPLLLHFALGFPQRPPSARRTLEPHLLPLIYLPAITIAVTRIIAVARTSGNGRLFSQIIDVLDRGEYIYLFVCVVAAIAVLARAFNEIESLTGRRQLRWLACGTIIGVAPFAFGYALPFALGAEPPAGLQLTAIPLGFVPLTFASAIVRYRLRDIEVIVKRGLGYATFLGATAFLYIVLGQFTRWFLGGSDSQNWVVAFLATLVVVQLAQPVKSAVQDALDRAFYRDRYDYRRALVAFARDLNTDLDLNRLSQRLVARVVETLALDRMTLMLADEPGDLKAIDQYGFVGTAPALSRESSFFPRLESGYIVALDGSDTIAAARFSAEEVDFWRDQSIYYFVPCMFEGTAIAVMALGRDETDEPFNSEDLALLTAVAGQVATAIENGRLYRELQRKADELDGMREFNENILESLESGLVVFDQSERVVRWNQALESFYGVSRADAMGQTLGDLFDSSFVDALRAARQENPAGATLFKVPLTARRSGEEGDANPRLLLNVTAVPLRDDTNSDTVTATILLLEDLTDRVRLEEQLQISEKMASIGLLAAGVAHEVNTPLTGISSYTQMLLEGADPADPKTTLLEKIERQTFRAAKIVNGLLTLSRPGADGAERSRVDLNDVISDVFALLEHQLTAGSIKVRRELSPSPVVVLGIEHQLQQVFLNLFLNARDAMPSGGWLTVTTRVSGEEYVAEVSDTGSGIPPEQLARIYDPFFTTKDIGRGTGLGLSISYGIVQEHDGTIRCDSTVGQGTRFTVALPPAPTMARSAVQ